MADNAELIARLEKEIELERNARYECDPGLYLATAEDALDALKTGDAKIAALEAQIARYEREAELIAKTSLGVV